MIGGNGSAKSNSNRAILKLTNYKYTVTARSSENDYFGQNTRYQFDAGTVGRRVSDTSTLVTHSKFTRHPESNNNRNHDIMEICNGKIFLIIFIL